MSAAAALSRSFGGLSGQRQGIVSILGNNNSADLATAKSSSQLPPPPPPLSLRRTLSADMSSNTWQLARATDFSSPMKKIASTNELRLFPDEESRQDEQPAAPGGLCDTWSAIMSAQKAKEEDKDLSPPYIHPLVRQSKSCLSEKSLEICTESLGSETGSEGFSSGPSSVSGDNDEEGEQTKEEQNIVVDPPQLTMQKFDMEDLRVAKLNSNGFVSRGGVSGGKKSLLPRSFPPPIPSLARGAAATETLHMMPHRDNGRLVLEAVSCASRNNFRAQREDGRLVLTFVPNEATEQIDGLVEKTADSATAEYQFEVELENPATKKLEEQMEMDEEEEQEDGEETEENKFEREEAPKLKNGMMSYHRLAVIMNKPISRNQTCWPKKAEMVEEEEDELTMKAIAPLTQSLPPRPPKSSSIVKAVVGATRKEVAAANVAAASSFNAYECCWKSKPMPAKSVLGPGVTQNININRNNDTNYNSGTTKFAMSSLQGQRHQDLVTKRGDYFVPMVKGCKEPRRSILFWEPYCIATS